MTHLKLAIPAIALLAFLSGCSTPSTSKPVDITPADSRHVAADDNKVQAFMLRGNIVLGHESYSIQPCGSTKQYWLNIQPADRQALMAIARPGYTPMYGELIGYLEPVPTEGFAADYDAQFQIKQINLVSAEMSQGCNRAPHSTRAFGHEPGWVVEINGDQASLLRPDNQHQQQRITDKQIQSGQQRYEGDTFELDMTKERCNDTMSDSLFGWQANLSWEGNDYRGCATLGSADITRHWVGRYQGTSYSGGAPVLITTVTLHPDHSATTRYDYPSGDPSTHETGFWQQAGDNTVQVVMTKHQGRRLISERRFALEGSSIVTREETVNGQTYSLGNDGLSLKRQ